MNDEKKDNGGPAFPCEHEGYGGSSARSSGMSLRDYFAGQALCGMFANTSEDFVISHRELASAAYATADAMIKARES